MEFKIASLESEAGFKALFRHASIAILVMGREGSIELLNPCAEKLFGYQAAELIGKPVEVLMPGHLRHRHVQHRSDFFEKPRARPMGYGSTLYALKKDGTEFPAEISLGHYQLDGEMLAVAFVTDISERKYLEDQLLKARENLEEKLKIRTLELTKSLEKEKEINELKSRLVSFASHEFRTPLTSILTSVMLIEQYADTAHEEKRNKHIERIKTSVGHLTEILNDFLSLDKLEQGKVFSEVTVFNLRQFLDGIFEEMEGMLIKKNQEILVHYSGPETVNKDPGIIKNIMLNLLSNAAKYSSAGSCITVAVETDDNHVCLSIKDTGIGIPEEEQGRLFEKFFRARNASSIQGTGLGLYLVKKYVELIDGTIRFTSKMNEGTTFLIRFPMSS